jgi:hypothetical protein
LVASGYIPFRIRKEEEESDETSIVYLAEGVHHVENENDVCYRFMLVLVVLFAGGLLHGVSAQS